MVFSFPGTFLLDIKSIKRVVLEGENSAYRNMPALCAVVRYLTSNPRVVSSSPMLVIVFSADFTTSVKFVVKMAQITQDLDIRCKICQDNSYRVVLTG